MRFHTALLSLLTTCLLWMPASGSRAAAPAHPQTRCGWFVNPTPGNAWLEDRDGEWTIATQGDYEADGDWPPFEDAQWVPVNGSHGYGCACLEAVVDAQAHRVVRILSARARPLEVCRRDRALKEPTG